MKNGLPIYKSGDILKRIKEKQFDRIYFLYGEDSMTIEGLTKKIVSKIVPKDAETYNLHKMSAENFSADEFCDTAEMYPIFSDYNCILVSNFNASNLKPAQLKIVMGELEQIPETTIVIFSIVSADLKNGGKNFTSANKRFTEFIEKSPCGVLCEINYQTVDELTKHIVKKVSKEGCFIYPSTAREIAERCLCSTMMITREIEKLTSYTQSGEITMSLVNEFVPRQLDSNAFKLARAVVMIEPVNVFGIIDDLFFQKEEALSILSALSYSFIDIYRARTAMANGKSKVDIIKDFNYRGREFAVTSAMNISRRISLENVRKCLAILEDADIKMKSSSYNDRIIIETAVTKMMMLNKNA